MKKFHLIICAIFALCVVSLNAQILVSDADASSVTNVSLVSESPPSRSMWDIVFRFEGTAGAQVAVATDGTNFFLGNWQTGEILRFDMAGTHLESFTIPGVSVIRSLTYDGTYFYAGDGSNNNFYKLDLTTKTLVATINAGGLCRHLCYDPTLDNGNGGFWHGDWTNVRAITMTGTQIFPSATVASVYGSAYDPYSDPDHPCLWLFAQTGTDPYRNNLLQWDITTRALTGVSYNVYPDIINPSAAPLAGGAFAFEMDGSWVLAANVQVTPNQIIIYELYNPNALPPCDKVTNLKAEVQGTDVKLTWTAPAGSPSGYKVYRETTELATVTETEYVVKKLADGEHAFSVEAIFGGECVPKKETISATIKSLAPIKNLDGNCSNGTLTLTWDKPDSKGGRDFFWLTYSDDIMAANSGIGLTNGGDIMAGARFTPSDLEDKNVQTGHVINSIAINMATAGTSNISVKIWEGGSSVADPGTLVVDQPVTTANNEAWTTVDLTSPWEIDASKELRIGYGATHTAGVYPVLFDNGPRVPNKSDLLFAGTWTTLYDAIGPGNYNRNTGVKAGIEGDVIPPEVIRYDVYQDDVKIGETETTTFTKSGVTDEHNYCVVAIYDNNAQSEKVCKIVACGACPPVTNLEISFDECASATLTWSAVNGATGYKVVRDGETLTTVTENTYTDEFEIDPAQNYKWEVITVCGTSSEATPEEITSTCVGIKEIEKTFSILPNPANDMITITSTNTIKIVEVINFLGQTVIYQQENKVDVSTLTSGVYFVRVAFENGIGVQKFVKQ